MALITLLTDFGLTEHCVAAMKGVIASIAPGARVVDITHDVPPFQIPEAAYLMYCSYRYFPPKTIHVMVVDPGVGTARRLLCLDTGRHRFLAPDNGVLTLILEKEEKSHVYDVSRTSYRLPQVSHTFHGRDILAPCAAHLARGVKPSQLGPAARNPVRLALRPRWRPTTKRLEGTVLHIDRFGNAITTITKRDAHQHGLARRASLRVRLPKQRLTVTRLAQTYGDADAPDAPVAVFGSSDFLELAINQGSFQQRWRVQCGDPVWVTA